MDLHGHICECPYAQIRTLFPHIIIFPRVHPGPTQSRVVFMWFWTLLSSGINLMSEYLKLLLLERMVLISPSSSLENILSNPAILWLDCCGNYSSQQRINLQAASYTMSSTLIVSDIWRNGRGRHHYWSSSCSYVWSEKHRQKLHPGICGYADFNLEETEEQIERQGKKMRMLWICLPQKLSLDINSVP